MTGRGVDDEGLRKDRGLRRERGERDGILGGFGRRQRRTRAGDGTREEGV